MQQKSFREILNQANAKYHSTPVESKTRHIHLTLEELLTPQGKLLSDIFVLTQKNQSRPF